MQKRKIHQNSIKTESTKNPNFSKIPEKTPKIQNSRFPYAQPTQKKQNAHVFFFLCFILPQMKIFSDMQTQKKKSSVHELF